MGNRFDFLRRAPIFVLVMCFLVMNAILASPWRLGVSIQKFRGDPYCLPEWFYLVRHGIDHVPQRGDYILGAMPAIDLGVGPKAGAAIVKRVVGIPGDTITIQGTDLYINGHFIDRLWLAKSIPGRTPESFQTSYTLGKNQFFVYGREHESFDSRYWGPLDGENIRGFVIPLF